MTPQKFDEIVANLAEKRVQERIAEFENVVMKAAMKLTGSGSFYKSEKYLVGLVANGKNEWPPEFWDREREAVAAELLAQLDVIQQAMLAPPASETRKHHPAEETP